MAKPKETPDEQYLSVTTAIGCLDKPALVPWAANAVADNVVRDFTLALKAWRDHLDDEMAEAMTTRPTGGMKDRAAAEAWRSLQVARDVLRDPRAARDSLASSRYVPINPATGHRWELGASQVGQVTHDGCDRWLVSGSKPATHVEAEPFMAQFGEFLEAFQPEPLLAEYVGVNRTFGYAGRGDAVVRMVLPAISSKPLTVLVDYKTSRASYRMDKGRNVATGPYPETAMQLAAYERFENVLRWDQAARLATPKANGNWYFVEPEEWAIAQPMPEIDACAVVWLTPDRWDVHPVTTGDWTFDLFKFVLEVARRTMGRGYKTLIGPAMSPPSRKDLRMVWPVSGPEPESELEGQLRESLEAIESPIDKHRERMAGVGIQTREIEVEAAMERADARLDEIAHQNAQAREALIESDTQARLALVPPIFDPNDPA